MHELGHVLGLDDLDPAFAPHDLMTQTLGLGVRRLPDLASAGGVAPALSLVGIGLEAGAPAASNPAARAPVQTGQQTPARASAEAGPALAMGGQAPAPRGQEWAASLVSAPKRSDWLDATDAYFKALGEAQRS
jgi:hypothetical protein